MLTNRPTRSLTRRSGTRRRGSASEALEDRSLLSTITVTSLADNEDVDGEVTLREAITAANEDTSVDGSVAGNGPDVIRFADGLCGTINIDGVINLRDGVTIRGNGASETILDAGGTSKVFRVATQQPIAIRDLTIQNASIALDVYNAKSVVAVSDE